MASKRRNMFYENKTGFDTCNPSVKTRRVFNNVYCPPQENNVYNRPVSAGRLCALLVWDFHLQRDSSSCLLETCRTARMYCEERNCECHLCRELGTPPVAATPSPKKRLGGRTFKKKASSEVAGRQDDGNFILLNAKSSVEVYRSIVQVPGPEPKDRFRLIAIFSGAVWVATRVAIVMMYNPKQHY
ncbi:hypothetical protein AAG570_002875 [Ranatra chinensis]|uniref:Uncharacterized protein n=1 Tax=Ranatra chinensis TaxID=642074 RepID=A0ABD0Y562_9HEMI